MWGFILLCVMASFCFTAGGKKYADMETNFILMILFAYLIFGIGIMIGLIFRKNKK